ncbi:MAG: response regulator [Verrucomicrobiales bacterium]|nr:response regulator [Verrucomicrobiales bacterium]
MIPGPTTFTPPESARQAPAGVTRVLVVDDEVSMRALGCAIVQSMGYQAIAANTGEECIDIFRNHLHRNEPIAAIIMDLALPGGMSGLETTDLLRAIDPRVAVIASSGYLQQNARAAALERGFAGILPKPYSPERLTAELRWVLNRR